MELWIRSQDKKVLTKINDIWLDDTDIIDKKYATIMANINSGDYEIGIYNTYERALEVLTEIQDKIQYSDSENYVGNKTIIVYQMPKE